MRFLAPIVFILFGFSLFASPLIRLTFEHDEVGKFPSGWKAKDQKEGDKVYSVQEEEGKKFLHADARGVSVQIGHEKKWELREFPILRWRWRAVTFPAGSNERVKSGADSVLGVYVVLSGLPFVKTIKYLWSDTLPAGTTLESPFSSGTKMIVLRSGQASAGTWVAEERNVLADYERLFKKKDASPVAQGIAVLTDADNTNSRSVGDYADIEILPKSDK